MLVPGEVMIHTSPGGTAFHSPGWGEAKPREHRHLTRNKAPEGRHHLTTQPLHYLERRYGERLYSTGGRRSTF